MYVKRHAVVKDGKRYVYLRLVEAYRNEDGRVRHRVLRTLGREDELKASGQLDQLAASFARLDPPPVGTRRQVGPLLLVRHYLQRLGLVRLVDAAARCAAGPMLTHGEVIAALVANRLAAPAPLYDVAGWASSAAVAELFGVPAAIAQRRPAGPGAGGAGPGGRDGARRAGAGRRVERCGADRPAAPGPDRGPVRRRLRPARRWSRRAGPPTARIARQVDPAGRHPRRGRGLLPAAPGRAAELACFGRRRWSGCRALAPPGLVVVADSGFGHLGTCARRRRRPAVRGAAARRHRLGRPVPADVRRPRRAAPARPRRRTRATPTRRPAHPLARRAARLDVTDPETGSRPTGCGWPTSGPARKPPPWPRPANAPWPRPRPNSPASATASAGATTRPASRSTTASPTSSAPASPTCSPSPPAPTTTANPP